MNRSRGQGLAEFALAVPIFLILLFGLFDLGRAVFAYNNVTNAAREGARLAIVNQDPASIQTRAQAQATGLTVAATIEFREPGPNPDAVDNDACSSIGIGCIAVVRVSTDWQSLAPGFGLVIAVLTGQGLTMGPVTLTAESQLPIEFVCPNPNVVGLGTPTDCPKQP